VLFIAGSTTPASPDHPVPAQPGWRLPAGSQQQQPPRSSISDRKTANIPGGRHMRIGGDVRLGHIHDEHAE